LTAAESRTGVSPVTRAEFSYDGFGRRTRIVEKQNGSMVSTKKFLWCGTGLSEERDSTGGTVTKRFFGQGEQVLGTNYFFTADHLGSIREMTDDTGAIRARYDYDPYGRRTKVSGDIEADFAFTGHYYHTLSGIYLTLFRAYDAETGRWISRDPIEEGGGLNLYNYVQNNPINAVDLLGLTSSLYGLAGAHAVDIAFLFAVPLPGLVADTGLSFLWYWGHECSFGDSVLNAGRDLLVQLVLGKAVGELAPVFMSVLGKAGVTVFGSSAGKATAESGSRFLFRTGSQTEKALTKLDGVSFRESISSSADRVQVFDPGEKIWSVDVSKLPHGSVVFDGGTAGLPAGHVSVNASAAEIKAAIVPHGPSNPLRDFGLKLLEDGSSYRIPKR
jgi:RHS repeat-associated protein